MSAPTSPRVASHRASFRAAAAGRPGWIGGGADRAIGVEQQHGEHGALLDGAERYLFVAVEGANGPQDLKALQLSLTPPDQAIQRNGGRRQ
jgi:hypothetical protein